MSLRLTEDEYAELRRRYQQRAREADAAEDAEARRKAERMLKPQPRPTRRKYNNQRVTVDGKTFDSKHEAEIYGELMLRHRAGELQVVMRQVPFDLPGGIRYIADFCTVDSSGRFEVIDAKSPITRKERTYINKKKQMKELWGLDIIEM